MTLLLAEATRPFAIAIGVVLALALLELVFLFAGHALSGLIDNVLPDHIDTSAGTESSVLGDALSFFGIGKVPVLVVLIVLLTLFGLAGFVLQAIVHIATGSYLPALLAAAPAALAGGYATRKVAFAIGRMMPNLETSAVSRDSFIGRTAIVTLGDISADSPGQAKLRDQHAQVHYLLIEPDQRGVTLTTGQTVLIVGQRRHIFLAIPAPSQALVEPHSEGEGHG
jgi:hypothetical protein